MRPAVIPEPHLSSLMARIIAARGNLTPGEVLDLMGASHLFKYPRIDCYILTSA